MMSINRKTININITASIIFITYIILNSIHSIDEKKVEIEKKNKVDSKLNFYYNNYQNILQIQFLSFQTLIHLF